MKIYLDDDYKCHVTKESDNYLEYETDLFDGKCQTFIEGYRIVPQNKNWTRSDGRIFVGEMVSPWKRLSELQNAQSVYEKQQIVSLTSQNEELLTTIAQMVEDTYQSDLATIGEEGDVNGTK